MLWQEEHSLVSVRQRDQDTLLLFYLKLWGGSRSLCSENSELMFMGQDSRTRNNVKVSLIAELLVSYCNPLTNAGFAHVAVERVQL